jgi:hypothetical protein
MCAALRVYEYWWPGVIFRSKDHGNGNGNGNSNSNSHGRSRLRQNNSPCGDGLRGATN